jgi:hypothetical protein
MGKPAGGALERHPGHDENDSLSGKGFGANLMIEKHGRSCPPLEFTLSEILPFP